MGEEAAIVGLGLDQLRTASQEFGSTHPIVGAWLSMNPGDPPSASPVSFTADGIMAVAWAPGYLDPEIGVINQSASLAIAPALPFLDGPLQAVSL